MKYGDDAAASAGGNPGPAAGPRGGAAPGPRPAANDARTAPIPAPGPTPVPGPSPVPGPGADAAAPSARRRRRRGRLVLLLVLLAGLAAGGHYGYRWWTDGRFLERTDDAYVGADMSVLAAKVTGYVTAVEVTDNQPVAAGDVIARIDDGDLRLAVRAAQDRITAQQATVARIGVQATAAEAAIDQARAEVASAGADLERTSLDLDRKSKLATNAYASRQALDNAKADRRKAAAALTAARAGLASATANVAVVQAQRQEAEQALLGLRTALAQAERDLSFAVIRAPVAGVVGNRAVEVGQLVQPGTRLAAIVPLDDVYVDANFKETQLARMRPGQTAEVRVDAFREQTFAGVVESISPASGALFSLLPPENATGNFTKVVQRLPVRIRLSGAAAAEHVLRPGMSVVVSVDTRTGGPAAGR